MMMSSGSKSTWYYTGKVFANTRVKKTAQNSKILEKLEIQSDTQYPQTLKDVLETKFLNKYL